MVARIDRQLRQKDMSLELTDGARRHLAAAGFDPSLGARPLRRAIQQEVEDALAERILFNDLRPGQRVLVSCVDDGLVFGEQLAAAL
jgi:ATP-dependent Clp protease ATP-binding subunit ClpC